MVKGSIPIPAATWTRILAVLRVCAKEMPCIGVHLEGGDPDLCRKTLGHDINGACRRHWAEDILKTVGEWSKEEEEAAS